MTDAETIYPSPPHQHVFLGKDHDKAERRTWAVIILCSVMMIAEIIGGALFGSLALIADGLHMSTHAGALLLAALAYTYARKYANDRSFTFGTGKFGDLAGYSSAIVLAMIALLIGYPWHILTACSVLFLLSLPAGWRSYRNHERSAAAQAATPVDVAASNPAPSFGQVAPEPEQDDRPARLN